MGKTTRNQKKKLAKRKKKTKLQNDLSVYSLEELLKKAQEEIDIFQYDNAQKLCQEALKRDADNLRALEISAGLCLENANIEGAKHCLGRAITLSPDSGFTKYFSMAQLVAGKDALQCYLKGIILINEFIKNIPKETLKDLESEEKLECGNEKSKENVANSEINEKMDLDKEKKENGINSDLSVNGEVTEENVCDLIVDSKELELRNSLSRKLSNAHCSVAELFMSDLCDEEEAETECQDNIQKAIDADLSNPEAYQCYASFLLVKENVEEARNNIKKSVSLWLPKYLEVDSGTAASGSFDPVEVCPLSQEAQFNCARILIEVEEHQLASDVLEGLLGEDDEDVYTWYLLGWNLYLQSDRKYEAKQHLQKALEIHRRAPSADRQVIDHIKELMKDLKDVTEPQDSVDNIDDDDSDMEIS